MEMWLRVSTLLCFTATAADAGLLVHTDIFLSDTQKSSQQTVEVALGSLVSLYCCLNTSEYQEYQIEWKFNSSSVFSIRVRNSSKMSNGTEKQCKDMEKKFLLKDVKKNNSGPYTCKVTRLIPYWSERSSNPTQVIVTTSLKESTTYSSVVTTQQVSPPPFVWQLQWWVWVLVGASSLFLIVLMIVCALKKRGCHRKRVAEPIYTNTHNNRHEPQPKVPRHQPRAGSLYQNLRTPGPARRGTEDKQGRK